MLIYLSKDLTSRELVFVLIYDQSGQAWWLSSGAVVLCVSTRQTRINLPIFLILLTKESTKAVLLPLPKWPAALLLPIHLAFSAKDANVEKKFI